MSRFKILALTGLLSFETKRAFLKRNLWKKEEFSKKVKKVFLCPKKLDFKRDFNVSAFLTFL